MTKPTPEDRERAIEWARKTHRWVHPRTEEMARVLLALHAELAESEWARGVLEKRIVALRAAIGFPGGYTYPARELLQQALDADDALAANREETEVEPSDRADRMLRIDGPELAPFGKQRRQFEPLPPTAERPPEAGEPSDEAALAYSRWCSEPWPEGVPMHEPDPRESFIAGHEAGRATEVAAHAETKRLFRVLQTQSGIRFVSDAPEVWHPEPLVRRVVEELRLLRPQAEAGFAVSAELERVRGAHEETKQELAELRVLYNANALKRENARLLDRARAYWDELERSRGASDYWNRRFSETYAEFSALREGREEPSDIATLRDYIREGSVNGTTEKMDDDARAALNRIEGALREGRPEPTARELGQKLQAAAAEFHGRSAVVGDRARAYWDELGGCAKRELLGVRPRVPTREELARLIRSKIAAYHSRVNEHWVVTFDALHEAADAVIALFATPAADRKDSGASDAAVRDAATSHSPGSSPAEAAASLVSSSEAEAPSPLPEVLPVGTRAVLRDGREVVAATECWLRPPAISDYLVYWASWDKWDREQTYVRHERIDWADYRAQQAKTPEPEQEEALVDELETTLESLDARLREVETQVRVTRRLAQLPYGDPAHEHFTNAAERIEREERETAK